MEQSNEKVDVHAYLQAGAQFGQIGEFDAALDAYHKALALDPNNVSAHLGLYQIYQARGAQAAAMPHLVRALEIQPNLIKSSEHVAVSHQLYATGKIQEAIESCQRGLSLNPDELQAHATMAELYLKTGRFDEAIRSYRKMILVEPVLGEHTNKVHFRSTIPYKIWKTETAQLEIHDDFLLCAPVLSKVESAAENHYQAAYRASQEGDLAKAAHLYQEAIKARADFAEAYFNLGSVFHAWQRGSDRAELLICAHKAFEHASKLKPDWAESHLKRGQLGTLIPAKLNPIEAYQTAMRLKPNMPEPYLQMGMFYYFESKVAESYKWLTEYTDRLEKQIADHPLGAVGVRFLTDEVVICIGHLGQSPDYHVKSQMLGWIPNYKTVLLAPPSMIANPALLDLWKKYICVITDPEQIRALRPLAKILQKPGWLGKLPDGTTSMIQVANSHVQREWDRQGRPSLLSLNDDQKKRGWDVMEKMGVPRSAWYVILQVRQPGYKPEGKGDVFDRSRNANPMDYLKAVQAITDMGGWVIRTGEATMTPLPTMPQVVDYAHSPYKNDWMDVFLFSQARFLLGGSSGITPVFQALHVPAAATDFPPTFINLANSWDLFTPKLLYSRREKRLLTFKEIASPPFVFAEWLEVFEEHDIDFVNNTPEEVFQLALEMLERLDGRAIYTPEDEYLQKKFMALYPPLYGAQASRIGRYFLRTHADLLRD